MMTGSVELKEAGDASLLLHFGGGGGLSPSRDDDTQKPAGAGTGGGGRSSPTMSSSGSSHGGASNGGIISSKNNSKPDDDRVSNKKNGSSSNSKVYNKIKEKGQSKQCFSIKKKKKREKVASRNNNKGKGGMNRQAHKATDTNVNAMRTLRSVVFQKESYISNPVPNEGHGRDVSDENQFEDAPEPADHPRLRQYHSSNTGGMTRPPVGYFSIHPSSLSLHPASAVHHYYPTTPHMNMTTGGPHQHQHPTMQHFHRPGFRAGFPGPGPHNGMPPFHNPNSMGHPQHHPQQQQHSGQTRPGQHLGTSPREPQHPMVQHHPNHPRMPGLIPQQQQQQQQPQQQQHQGVPPSFMEYAAKRRQQHPQHQHPQQVHSNEQLRQQDVLKMNQEALKQEQLRILQEKKMTMNQMKLKGTLNGVVGGQQRHPHGQQHMNQAQGPHMPRPGPYDESHAPAGTSAEQSGVSAMLALAAAREVGDPAAAAALLQNFAQQKKAPRSGGGNPEAQKKHLVLQEIEAMSAALRSKRQQERQVHPTQEHQQQQEYAPLQRPPPAQDLSSAVMAKRIRPKIMDEAEAFAVAGTSFNGKSNRSITTTQSGPLITGMDQLETLPMLRSQAPDIDKEHPVRDSEFRECDVLLGRGGMTNHHIGNTHFRALVARFRVNYHAAKKGVKGMLSKKLANFVRHKGGRFLQKDDVDQCWYEVGDQRAHGKCAQALREGTVEVPREDGDKANEDRQQRRIAPRPTSTSGDSSDGDGSYNANEYASNMRSDRMSRPAMPPASTSRAATQQQASPRCVIVRQDSTSKSSSSSEGRRTPMTKTSNTETGTHPAMTDRNSMKHVITEDRIPKSNRARARDWGSESAGGQYQDDGSGMAQGEAQDYDHASKRAKIHHHNEDDDDSQFDYI